MRWDAGASEETPAPGLAYRGVKKPQTLPSIHSVPCGPEKSIWDGIEHSTVFVNGPAFADMFVFGSGLPPVGVNVNVRSNAVGMNTDVLPMPICRCRFARLLPERA